uniref:Putative secreted salivary protein n=1 Tax=Ixodes scapularis TaxID=6945 RepID=Q4PMR9_IXOSC|nr:putative secreted salivary protein [Ixodes scapularis]
MRAPAIVIISLLLLECFYSVEGQRKPVVKYSPNGSCRRFCDTPRDCTKICNKCHPGNPWTPKKCVK